MFSSPAITIGFISSLMLLCFLPGLHSQPQPPILTLTSISEGCIVDGQSMVLAEGTANFTGRDSITEWSNRVNLFASGDTICIIPLDVCPSPRENCFCQNDINQEYRIVMNHTARKELTGKNVIIYAARNAFPLTDAESNILLYPKIVDQVQEMVLFSNSSSFDFSSGTNDVTGIIPDDVTSINYTVTGLEEPYNIMYNVSEPLTHEALSNTTSIIANFSTSQRIFLLGYEELGPTCHRQFTHTLCRKGGIGEIIKFDDEVATGNVFPENATKLTYTLSEIIEPYVVEVTITYTGLPQANHTYDNTSTIQLAINGSKEICIRYNETGTGRLSQCLGHREHCYYAEVPTTESPTENTSSTTETPSTNGTTEETPSTNGTTEGPSCPCDCDDWKEPYTVVLFIAMLIQLICGVVVLVLYCFREKFPLWPIVTLVLSFVMVATVVCTIGFMCYQEIDDCGLCDCQYTFILIEMIVTLLVIFFIMIILYKEGGEYFKQKWLRSLLLLLAVVMAAFSIIGIVVVFCNKEISGSGAESWHIIYLLIGIAMAAIVLIGIIALFVCQSGQIKHDDDSRNGKMLKKEPKEEHVELSGKTDGDDGKPNPAYTDQVDRGQTNQSHGDSGNNTDQSPRRLPPLQDNKDFNSIPPSSISSHDTNQDTTEVRKLKKKKKKKGDSEKVQLSQDSVTSKESTDVSSPRRHSNSKIHPEESLGLKSAGRPLPSPRSHLPPLKV